MHCLKVTVVGVQFSRFSRPIEFHSEIRKRQEGAVNCKEIEYSKIGDSKPAAFKKLFHFVFNAYE
jgi:hypothetical protein